MSDQSHVEFSSDAGQSEAAGGPDDISQLLRAWSNGDELALSELTPIVYAELRRLAHRYMRRERAGHSLQTTALVNEAYMRLVDCTRMQWQDRAHFFAVSSQLLRRILVDHARRQNLSAAAGCRTYRWTRPWWWADSPASISWRSMTR